MGSVLRVGKRWRAQVRRRGYQSVAKTFDRKAEADAWVATVEAKMHVGAFDSPAATKDMTVADLVDWYRRTVDGSTEKIGRSKDAVLAYWSREHGEVVLADLTPAWLVEWAKTRQVAPARPGGPPPATPRRPSPATIAQDISALGSAIRLARLLRAMPAGFDPVAQAREPLRLLKLVGKSGERDRRVTPDELTRLVEYFRAKRRQVVPMHEIIPFAIASAMRASEITRLRWADLNERDRTIVIRDRKDPDEKVGNDQTVPLLRVGDLDAFEIVKRQPRAEGQELVFPYNSDTFSSIFPRACQALDLPIRDLRFHDLRHEGISRLFEAGYSIEQVALVSGHRSWTQLKRYTNLRARDLHR